MHILLFLLLSKLFEYFKINKMEFKYFHHHLPTKNLCVGAMNQSQLIFFVQHLVTENSKIFVKNSLKYSKVKK